MTDKEKVHAGVDANGHSANSDSRVRRLDDHSLRVLKNSIEPAFIKVDPLRCAKCAKLAGFWAALSLSFPDGPLVMWHAPCEEVPAVCQSLLSAVQLDAVHDPAGGHPLFLFWTGATLDAYPGPFEPEAIIRAAHFADANASTIRRCAPLVAAGGCASSSSLRAMEEEHGCRAACEWRGRMGCAADFSFFDGEAAHAYAPLSFLELSPASPPEVLAAHGFSVLHRFADEPADRLPPSDAVWHAPHRCAMRMVIP